MTNRNRRNNNRSRRNHDVAWAPYNFVPLQDGNQLMEATLHSKDNDGNPIPKRHDVYDGHSGYFDVTLTTESLTYIRGMLTAKEALAGKEAKDKSDFFSIDGETPMIPGSSLHGMLRNLYEIITFGKVHFVSDSHKMFFRAVAADRSDPLKFPYENIIGKFGRNVRSGYLKYANGKWFIRPARKQGRDAYAKVKDQARHGNIPVAGVKNMKRFNDDNYEVQYHDVVFKTKGDFITEVSTPSGDEMPMGVLVCSGNMLETQSRKGGNQQSPRKNYALVLEPEPRIEPIPIDNQAIIDYREGLSDFQKEQFHKSNGMLKDGRPVFYVDDGHAVIHFGHTPNFRVAPRVKDDEGLHAVTPLDRVPWQLRKGRSVKDWTETVFGYVAENQDNREIVAYAGRISVTSATVLDGQSDYYERTVTPNVLASPKPTTFQHYLEQPQGTTTETHRLQHYGDDSIIRGHKLYWRQMITDISAVEETDDKINESQQTKITPLKKGICFAFKVHFDNLTDEELGALAWVLTLDNDLEARHQIGMGKPFGMGIVKLDATLNLIHRNQRHKTLFDADGKWMKSEENINNEDVQGAINAFKNAVDRATGTAFDKHERIQQLKMMLTPVTPAKTFTYMQIEPQNEYDGRPVLPYPNQVKK